MTRTRSVLIGKELSDVFIVTSLVCSACHTKLPADVELNGSSDLTQVSSLARNAPGEMWNQALVTIADLRQDCTSSQVASLLSNDWQTGDSNPLVLAVDLAALMHARYYFSSRKQASAVHTAIRVNLLLNDSLRFFQKWIRSKEL